MVKEEELTLNEEQKLELDLKYIRNEIISKQPNGNYVKFSRMLGETSCINDPKSKFIKYWESRYNSNSNSRKRILEALENKLTEGLTPIEDMIELINNSKDREGEKAIKYLLGIKKD